MNESQFAHNTYLQALAEGGLAVGIPLLIAAIALAGVFLDGARSGRPFLAIACLTFLIHNLVDFTFYIPSTGFVFACLAGLAAARGEHARSYRRGRLLRGGLCLLLAGFALLVGRADAVRDAGRDRFLAGDLSGAVRMARRAVRRDPLDPDARSLLARLKLQQAISGHDTALLVSAEEEARRAVRLDPRTPHHWDLLAKVRLARSDLLGAYVAAARAAELYPIKIGYRKTRDAIAAAIPAATKAAP